MYQSAGAFLVLVILVPLLLMPIVTDGQYTGFKAYLQALGCVMLGVLGLGLLWVFGLLVALLMGLK